MESPISVIHCGLVENQLVDFPLPHLMTPTPHLSRVSMKKRHNKSLKNTKIIGRLGISNELNKFMGKKK
jgi:hypothetical protein